MAASKSLPSPQASAAPRRLEDWVGGGIALLFGACSLPLPFGRDQALYFYVAREWVLRGAIPYRDVFDHKTPGIYVLHALAITLFGENQWGIRVVDFAAVLATGFVLALLATVPGTTLQRGIVGRSLALVSVLFYGMLGFWDTAQSELHYALLGCAAIACALHVRRTWLAGLCAGLCAGLAVLMKPPVIWFLLLAVGVLFVRVRREPLRRGAVLAAAFTAGAALPVAATLGYFAAHHAIGALLDVVVGANGYYVSHEHDAHPLVQALDSSQQYLTTNAPVASLLIGGGVLAFVLARRSPAWRVRLRFAFLLVGAAYAAAAMQMKFYPLHWVAMVPALAVLALVLGDYVEDGFLARGYGARAARLAPWLLFFGAYLTSTPARAFVDQQVHTALYLAGRESREAFAGRFEMPWLHFSYADAEWTGNWLAEHSTPADYVAVRGFEPEVYVVAHRRHAGRFFWTEFLTAPARAYRRPAYLAEDRSDLLAHPPRFVVVRRDALAANADSVEYMQGLGYQVQVVHGMFAILSKPTEPSRDE